MPIPSGISEADDAIRYLKSTPNLTVADVTQLMRQLGTKVEGNVVAVLLYSGKIDSGTIDVSQTYAWELAENIGVSSSKEAKIATVGQTKAAQFLNHLDFRKELGKVVSKENGWSELDPRLWPEVDRIIDGKLPDGSRSNTGLGDLMSAQFIAENVTSKTPVETFTISAEDGRVFSQTEVEALLKSEAPSIDGLSKSDYVGIFDRSYKEAKSFGLSDADAKAISLADVRDAIKVKSFDSTMSVEYTRGPGPEGKIEKVDVGKMFADVPTGPKSSPIPDGTAGKQSVAAGFEPYFDEHFPSLSNGADQHARQQGFAKFDADPANHKTVNSAGLRRAGAKLLNALGFIGDVAGLTIAIGAANKAYAAGDTEAAVRIVGGEIVGIVGGTLASAAAVAIATPLLPAAGVGAAAGLLAAAVVGGMFGDAAARAAWDAALSKVGEMGLIPKGGIDGIIRDFGELLDDLKPAVGGLIPDWLKSPADRFGAAPNAPSPLVLDLDGDGIETIAMGYGATGSATYFDVDNDGFAERTGWVSGGDGLLALDANGNGVIDNRSELFGNTLTHADGFAALKALDSNNDGKITSADAQWSALKVWVDADRDGVTGTGELRTLADLKISQINLTAKAHNNLFNNENQVTASSTFLLNGQTRTISDVWFRSDRMDTRFTGSTVFNAKTLFLPTLRGFGTLKDLHIAMSGDEALLAMVEAFAANWSLARFTDHAALEASVRAILFEWGDVTLVVDGSRGALVDAKEIAFMEKLTGQYFGGGAEPVDPTRSGPASSVSTSFDHVLTAFTSQLIAQVAGPSLFEMSPSYSFKTGDLSGGLISTQALASLGASGTTSEKREYWQKVVDVLAIIKDYEAFTPAEKIALTTAIRANLGASYSPETFMKAVALSLTGDALTNWYVGQGAADSLSGGGGDDILSGKGGDDSLFGGNGKDTLTGGRGDDRLQGGAEDDIYVYASGDGVDRISETSGNDTLLVQGSYAKEDISLTRERENDLAIMLKGQVIATVSSHLYDESYRLENIKFDDGNSIGVSGIKNLRGDKLENILTGVDHVLLNSDVIYGEDGNDTLNGGIGDDSLYGGAGDDRYVYSAGLNQGTDIIRDSGGTLDTIALGTGYTRSNVTLERIGLSDLAIKSAGKILYLIEGQFTSTGSVEALVYGDNNIINLLTYSHTFNGTTNNDTLYGTSFGAGGDKVNGLSGNDVIRAGAGNDTITGGDGSDTLYGEDGNDTLSGNAGADTIYGGDGNDVVIYESGLDRISDSGGSDLIRIADASARASDVTLRRNRGNAYDLDVLLKDVHAFTIQGQFSLNRAFESIRFADGSALYLSSVQYTTTGTSANDHLYGISSGGNPNDIVHAGAGNDYLFGYEGNDSLNGGLGTDRLYGGGGNDIYVVDFAEGADVIADEGGIDTIQFGVGFSKNNMTLERDTINKYDLKIAFGGVLAVTVENYFLSDKRIETARFADNTSYNLAGVRYTQNGTDSGEILNGHDGIDILKAGGGNDRLSGLAGNDTLEGGPGADSMSGGLGDDTFVFGIGFGAASSSLSDIVTENLGEGLDTVIFTSYKATDLFSWTTSSGLFFQSKTNLNEFVQISGSLAGGALDVGSRMESVRFSDSTSWTLSSGLTIRDNDIGRTLYGSLQSDSVEAAGGNDRVSSSAGDDTLNGGVGQDSLYGGVGDDTYIFDSDFGGATVATIELVSEKAGEGNDTVRFTSLKSTDVFTWTTSAGLFIQSKLNTKDVVQIEGLLTGGALDVGVKTETVTFSDMVVWALSSGLNLQDTEIGRTLYGSTQNDIVKANGGNDRVLAASGNDTIDGGSGIDSIYGEAGDDVLNGGSEADLLIGGSGADRFVFDRDTAFGGADTISDFSQSESDCIDIKSLLSGYSQSNNLITDFVQITTSGRDSILKVDADGGANGFVHIATIKGIIGLTDEAALVSQGHLLVA